jgi:hypothetical protein
MNSDPSFVQPVASRYTKYAIIEINMKIKIPSPLLFNVNKELRSFKPRPMSIDQALDNFHDRTENTRHGLGMSPLTPQKIYSLLF